MGIGVGVASPGTVPGVFVGAGVGVPSGLGLGLDVPPPGVGLGLDVPPPGVGLGLGVPPSGVELGLGLGVASPPVTVPPSGVELGLGVSSPPVTVPPSGVELGLGVSSPLEIVAGAFSLDSVVSSVALANTFSSIPLNPLSGDISNASTKTATTNKFFFISRFSLLAKNNV